jgi:hypothetical protein
MGTLMPATPTQTLYVSVRRDELRQLKDERDQLRQQVAHLNQLLEQAACKAKPPASESPPCAGAERLPPLPFYLPLPADRAPSTCTNFVTPANVCGDERSSEK